MATAKDGSAAGIYAGYTMYKHSHTHTHTLTHTHTHM